MLGQAIAKSGLPSVEAHYTNVHSKFISTVSKYMTSVVVGCKHKSYYLGLASLKNILDKDFNQFDYQETSKL